MFARPLARCVRTAETKRMDVLGGRGMSTIFNFEKKMAYSQGVQQASDIETIRSIITGCVSVKKTSTEVDRNGIDYIAELRGGAKIRIDSKTREIGCSQYWQNGEPELAPEIWSVMPNGKYHIPREQAKTGWTLTER